MLRVPAAAWPGLPGDILAAIVAAGAFAAFMSTASGLLVSIAGTVSHDVVAGAARGGGARGSGSPPARGHGRSRRCSRWARARSTSRVLVGWAFALAASTFCPLLLLGIWWPRLTARGRRRGHARRRDRWPPA